MSIASLGRTVGRRNADVVRLRSRAGAGCSRASPAVRRLDADETMEPCGDRIGGHGVAVRPNDGDGP